MASRVGFFAKNNLFLLHKSFTKQLTLNATRFLYCEQSLGIEGFKYSKEHVKSQFDTVTDQFREKMKKNVLEESQGLVFTEDLKNFVHLIEKNDEDFVLLKKMIIKYHCHNKIRLGTFIFGTIIMRALHYYREPDLALELMFDPQLSGFFEQTSSYQIIMDLLYEEKKYDEVHKVYDDLMERNIGGIIHHKNPFILDLATCYKQNTPESYERAKHIFFDFISKGYICPRRAIAFKAAAAINNKDAVTALEVLTLAKSKTYIDIRCLKLECYVLLKDIEKITMCLKSALMNVNSYKLTFFKDTIMKLENLIQEENLSGDNQIITLFDRLKKLDLIQDMSLEDHICSDIKMVKNTSVDRRTTQFKRQAAQKIRKAN